MADDEPSFESLRLTTYNLNSGTRAERMLSERLPEVLQLLRKIDADVLCLQELRDIEGQTTALETLRTIAHDLKMEYVWVPRNGTAMAFVQAILWKPEKLLMRGNQSRWISHADYPSSPPEIKPPNWGSVALCCHFLVRNGASFGLEFAVICVHFPLEEADKLFCMTNLRRWMEIIALRGGTPVFAMGDFNVFMDRQGKRQLRLMKDARFTAYHLTEKYVERDDEDNEREISGTFFGDESDPFKQDMSSPSPLDHIFFGNCTNKVSTLTYPVVHVVREPDGTAVRQKQPSDHCPLSVDMVY